jgi:hypothetical protein
MEGADSTVMPWKESMHPSLLVIVAELKNAFSTTWNSCASIKEQFVKSGFRYLNFNPS